RQEVESRMAELVVPGAPVSVLLEHGLTETMVEKLNEAGIGLVEKLGEMTPEQLEEIPGIGPKMVERIQQAVVSYYGQFESAVTEAPSAAGAEAAPEPPSEESVKQKEDQEQSVTIGTEESAGEA